MAFIMAVIPFLTWIIMLITINGALAMADGCGALMMSSGGNSAVAMGNGSMATVFNPFNTYGVMTNGPAQFSSQETTTKIITIKVSPIPAIVTVLTTIEQTSTVTTTPVLITTMPSQTSTSQPAATTTSVTEGLCLWAEQSVLTPCLRVVTPTPIPSQKSQGEQRSKNPLHAVVEYFKLLVNWLYQLL